MQRKVKRAVDTIMAGLEATIDNEPVGYSDQAAPSEMEIHVENAVVNVMHEIPMIINTDEPSIIDVDSSISTHDYESDSASDHTVDEITECENDDERNEYGNEFDIKNRLHDWAVTFNISQAAVTALLHILWLAGLEVPKDARTLLKTPEETQIKQISGGNYYHLGVEKGILASLRRNDNLTDSTVSKLSLNINVDGLPLFRSSNVQLWPILGNIATLSKADVFIIGLYSGASKPANVTTFLHDFVVEMKNIISNCLNDLNRHYAVEINAIICDAPAQSSIKCIKGHGGYSACERCTQTGVYTDRKMTYPELHAALRTDADFSVHKDEEH